MTLIINNGVSHNSTSRRTLIKSSTNTLVSIEKYKTHAIRVKQSTTVSYYKSSIQFNNKVYLGNIVKRTQSVTNVTDIAKSGSNQAAHHSSSGAEPEVEPKEPASAPVKLVKTFKYQSQVPNQLKVKSSAHILRQNQDYKD